MVTRQRRRRQEKGRGGGGKGSALKGGRVWRPRRRRTNVGAGTEECALGSTSRADCDAWEVRRHFGELRANLGALLANREDRVALVLLREDEAREAAAEVHRLGAPRRELHDVQEPHLVVRVQEGERLLAHLLLHDRLVGVKSAPDFKRLDERRHRAQDAAVRPLRHPNLFEGFPCGHPNLRARALLEDEAGKGAELAPRLETRRPDRAHLRTAENRLAPPLVLLAVRQQRACRHPRFEDRERLPEAREELLHALQALGPGGKGAVVDRSVQADDVPEEV
mmetsp:Transcript_21955/g.70939  ORF Transcript_21955/g.70939 Transcript_21955/m.70939 type:complete len:280 (+) Transcript_21955:5384-6223(+)